MKYDDFNELVREKLAGICGSDFSVSVYEALKNNSVVHKGISIKEQDNNVAPTIYMDEFYTDYCDGRDIEDIVNDILRIYSENREGPVFDTSRFSDFEWIKDKVFFKLINAGKNETMLKRSPYCGYLDLAMVFGVYMGNFKGTFSSVMITKEHLDMWQRTPEDIRELAVINTPRILPSAIWTIKDILGEMGEAANSFISGIPMYILSNRERVNGAAVMLYDGILSRISDNLGSDLYIIPSSIHELILVPESEIHSPDELSELIAEVNDTEVSKEEVLSYSLYRYDRERDIVDMVCAAGKKITVGA